MNHTEAISEIIKIIPDPEEVQKTYETGNSFMVINGNPPKQNIILKISAIIWL